MTSLTDTPVPLKLVCVARPLLKCSEPDFLCKHDWWNTEPGARYANVLVRLSYNGHFSHTGLVLSLCKWSILCPCSHGYADLGPDGQWPTGFSFLYRIRLQHSSAWRYILWIMSMTLANWISLNENVLLTTGFTPRNRNKVSLRLMTFPFISVFFLPTLALSQYCHKGESLKIRHGTYLAL